MRAHLQRLSTWSKAMAGAAAVIALFQLVYWLTYVFSSPPPAAPTHLKASDTFNNATQNVMSDTGAAIWKYYTACALLVALANAGLNWLASKRYAAAEQYGLLVGVAVFNLGFGAVMCNHWFPAVLGCLMGIPVALYSAGILISDEAKKVFRLVSTGRSLEDALSGRPALSGRRAAVSVGDTFEGAAASIELDAEIKEARALTPGADRRLAPTPDHLSDEEIRHDLDAEIAEPPAKPAAKAPAPSVPKSAAQPTAKLSGQSPAPKVSGINPAPQASGAKPAPKVSGLAPAAKLSGARPAPKISGQRPAPGASGARPAPKKKPPEA